MLITNDIERKAIIKKAKKTIPKDLTPKLMANFVRKFNDSGATILGGCCETRPAHINQMAKFK